MVVQPSPLGCQLSPVQGFTHPSTSRGKRHLYIFYRLKLGIPLNFTEVGSYCFSCIWRTWSNKARWRPLGFLLPTLTKRIRCFGIWISATFRVESVVKVYIMMAVSGVYRGCCGQHKVTSLFWNPFLITREINYWSLPSSWHSLIVGVLKIFNNIFGNRTFLFFIYTFLDVGSCMRKVLYALILKLEILWFLLALWGSS